VKNTVAATVKEAKIIINIVLTQIPGPLSDNPPLLLPKY